MVLALLILAWPSEAGHNEAITCAQAPGLVGDVTSVAGSCTTIITAINGVPLSNLNLGQTLKRPTLGGRSALITPAMADLRNHLTNR
jgi:hypothetical protein